MTVTEAPAPAASRWRPKAVALGVLQGLLAALFLFGGVNILFGLQQEMLDNFARMGFGDWFRYLTGAVELIGAVGLLVPRLAAYAALWLAGVMVGAVVVHLTVLPPAALAIPPAVLCGLFLLLARARWR